MNISGSVALVSGANRGLGRAFARELVRRGAAKVYGAARNPAAITELHEQGWLIAIFMVVARPVRVSARRRPRRPPARSAAPWSSSGRGP